MRLAFASVDSKAAFLLQCGWVSSNPLRAWEAKKGWERGDPSGLPAWAGALISPAFRAGLNNWLHLGLEPAGFQSELHIELVLLCRTLTNTSVWGEGASPASIGGAYASQVTTTSLLAIYKVLLQTSSLIPTQTLGRRNWYSPMYRRGNWGPQRPWCAPGPPSFLTPPGSWLQYQGSSQLGFGWVCWPYSAVENRPRLRLLVRKPSQDLGLGSKILCFIQWIQFSRTGR